MQHCQYACDLKGMAKQQAQHRLTAQQQHQTVLVLQAKNGLCHSIAVLHFVRSTTWLHVFMEQSVRLQQMLNVLHGTVLMPPDELVIEMAWQLATGKCPT